mgnify:CR=1 FL=1
MTLPVWKRLGVIGTGLITLEVFNQTFDYVLYPLAIGFLGLVKGGVVMTVASLILNYSLVLVYNKTKQDWLGFEWLALQEDKKANSLLGRVIRGGRWPAFILLSLEDPFKAFVFMRGRKQDGWRFSATYWRWFFFVNLVWYLVWAVMVSGVIEIFRVMFLG